MANENNASLDEKDQGTEENSALDDGQETAQRKYAGKYNSPEDLEKGYQDLESMHGRTASELGGVKTQMQQLQDAFAAANQPKPAQEEVVDYNKMRQQVVDQFQSGTIDEVTMADRIADIKASKVAQDYENRFAQQEESLLGKFQEELGKRDQQASYKQFTQENPAFEEKLQDGTLKQVMDENPWVRDEYDAYYAWQASDAKASVEQVKQQALEAGKAEALKQINGSQPAQGVAGGSGQSFAAPAGAPTAQAPNKAELFQGGLEAFRQAGGAG
jgi:hypothetical protein